MARKATEGGMTKAQAASAVLARAKELRITYPQDPSRYHPAFGRLLAAVDALLEIEAKKKGGRQ